MNERASMGFRRGHRDAYAGVAKTGNPYGLPSFAYYDWIDGHEAASAEMYWDEKALKLRRNMGTDE